MPTDRQFTGQQEMADLGGIYSYNARFYSPTLGRFLSADTVVPAPSDPQQLNRYTYVLNNPIRYTDPTGHMCDEDGICYNGNNADRSNISTKNWHRASYTETIKIKVIRKIRSKKSDYIDPCAVIPDMWDTSVTSSEELINFVMDWEGFSSTPYNDSSGNCTVGFGHLLNLGACTADTINKYDYKSTDQYIDYFVGDLYEAERGVRNAFQVVDNKYFKNITGYKLGEYVPIIQSQFDALVDFSYQQGMGNANDLITQYLIADQNPPHQDNANFKDAMTGYYSSPGGLATRRQEEIDMFYKGIYDSTH
jgi:RHS repeat-associated protein